MVVLYRKYRPQKIAEIDSPAVREKLETILSVGKIPHAFLFTGPKGTGKTSSARIIAKSVNCERNDGKGEPCNKCSTCVSITNGSNMDIIEIDAASNRGIDEIRDLRDKIRLSPSSCRKKIYIIDEVHMLTNEAFNALLKTLEEPPEHVIFVLCTTNAEKLPETIISRCRQIEFKRATTLDLVESLKRVKKGEEREIDKEALAEIAQRSEGSYRDSHKLLEEVLTTYPRAKITLEIVKKVLGEKETADNLFAWVEKPSAKEGLEMIGKLVEKGADLKFIIETMLNILHAHLLKKYQIEDQDFVVNEKLDNLTIEQLKQLIFLFSRAGLELKTSLIPQLALELAIVEWCEKKTMGWPQVANGNFGSASDSLVNKDLNIKNNSSALANEASQNLLASRPPKIPEVSKIVTRQPPENEKESQTVLARRLPENEDQALAQKWEDLLTAVKPYNHSVAGLLNSCKPASYDGKILTLEVFYKFHYDKLSEPKIGELLDKVGEEVFGCKTRVIPTFNPKR